MSYLSLFIFSCLVIGIVHCDSLREANTVKFAKKIHNASVYTESVLKKIYDDWQVEKYPNFLKTGFMHRSSWELMKYKFIHLILTTEITMARKDFIIGFMGSTVTAGYNSHYNQSYPAIIEDYFKPIMNLLDVDIKIRNGAMGNSPCVPYDMCPKSFVGNNTDIIVWEQSYTCGNKPEVVEHFIRQSLTIPTKPIIAFAESATGTWDKAKCTQKMTKALLTEQEKDILRSTPFTIFTEKNKDQFKKIWSHSLHNMNKLYNVAGIQTFSHTTHEEYACYGPYVTEWQSGAAVWNPSVHGHRMRAAQYSFVWLSILNEALVQVSVELNKNSMEDIIKETVRKLHNFYFHAQFHVGHHSNRKRKKIVDFLPSFLQKAIQDTTDESSIDTYGQTRNQLLLSSANEEKIVIPDRLYPAMVPDNVQCFTDYSPLAAPGYSLKSLVVSGLSVNNTGNGWKFDNFDLFHEKSAVEKRMAAAMRDNKFSLYGNKDDGALSLWMNPNQLGPFMLCESVKHDGNLPSEFIHLRESGMSVYISEMSNNFEFNPTLAVKIDMIHDKKLEACLQSSTNVTSGEQILTIVPSHQKNILISWLLYP